MEQSGDSTIIKASTAIQQNLVDNKETQTVVFS